jgi:hypothetical protein
MDGGTNVPAGFMPRYGANFVLGELEDMRLVYCARDELTNRTQRGVCCVISVFTLNSVKEIAVSTNSTLGEVLRQSGRSGQQFRVVQKNAILQSEFPSSLRNLPESFKQIHVHPGDIVVVVPFDYPARRER